MIEAIFFLLGCDLLGEGLRDAANLPVPGPVIGMLLLAAYLIGRPRLAWGSAKERDLSPGLDHAAETLIANMGLLFVPAGVGVITETGVLESEWLPILIGVTGSTLLGLVATALTMHLTLRDGKSLPTDALVKGGAE